MKRLSGTPGNSSSVVVSPSVISRRYNISKKGRNSFSRRQRWIMTFVWRSVTVCSGIRSDSASAPDSMNSRRVNEARRTPISQSSV